MFALARESLRRPFPRPQVRVRVAPDASLGVPVPAVPQPQRVPLRDALLSPAPLALGHLPPVFDPSHRAVLVDDDGPEVVQRHLLPEPKLTRRSRVVGPIGTRGLQHGDCPSSIDVVPFERLAFPGRRRRDTGRQQQQQQHRASHRSEAPPRRRVPLRLQPVCGRETSTQAATSFYFPSEGAPAAALRETQSPCADNSMADDDDEVVDNTAKANRADMNSLGGGGDDDGGVDAEAAKKRALEMATDDLKQQKAAEAARLKELMAVKISQEDVATIVSEIEVEKKAAEMRLREHGGDVVAALKSYVL